MHLPCYAVDIAGGTRQANQIRLYMAEKRRAQNELLLLFVCAVERKSGHTGPEWMSTASRAVHRHTIRSQPCDWPDLNDRIEDSVSSFIYRSSTSSPHPSRSLEAGRCSSTGDSADWNWSPVGTFR
jgi:hypothetical protein